MIFFFFFCFMVFEVLFLLMFTQINISFGTTQFSLGTFRRRNIYLVAIRFRIWHFCCPRICCASRVTAIYIRCTAIHTSLVQGLQHHHNLHNHHCYIQNSYHNHHCQVHHCYLCHWLAVYRELVQRCVVKLLVVV